MKGKGKVAKNKDSSLLKLNLEKIYSKSSHTQNSVLAEIFNDLPSDYDNQRLLSSSSVRFSNPNRKTIEPSSLLKFSLKLQSASKSIQQYFSTLKADTLANITYEDLGQFVYNPGIPGFNNTLSETESYRRVATTGASDTANSPKLAFENRFERLDLKPNGRSYTSLTPRSPQPISHFQTHSNKFSDSHRQYGQSKPLEPKNHEVKEKKRSKPLARLVCRDGRTLQGVLAKKRSVGTEKEENRLLNLNIDRLDSRATPVEDDKLGVLSMKENKTITSPSQNKDRDRIYFHKSRSFKRETPSFLKEDYSKFQEKLANMNIKNQASIYEVDQSRKSPVLEEINTPIIEIHRETTLEPPQKSQKSPVHSIKIEDQAVTEKEEEKQNTMILPRSSLLIPTNQDNDRYERSTITTSSVMDSRVSINLSEENNEDKFPKKQQLSRKETLLDVVSPSKKLQKQHTKPKTLNFDMDMDNALHSSPKTKSIQIDKQPKNPASHDYSSFSSLTKSLQISKPLSTEISLIKNDRISLNASPEVIAVETVKNKDERDRKSLQVPQTQKESKKKTLRSRALAIKLGRSFISSLEKKETKTVNRREKKSMTHELQSPERKDSVNSPELLRITTVRRKSKDEVLSADKLKKSVSLKKTNNNSNLFGEKIHPKLKKKVTIPLIRVIASEDPPSVESVKGPKNRESTISISSPDASSIKSLNESAEIADISSPGTTMLPNDPMTWFNFSRRNLKPKLKRLRSFRISPDQGSMKSFLDTQTEFLAALDQTLNNTIKSTQVNPGTLPKSSEEHDVTSKTLPRQISKSSAPLEELLKHDFDEEDAPKALFHPEARKTLSNDNEGTTLIKTHPLQPGERTNHSGVGTTGSHEESSKNILRMYSRRDGIIVINMYPAIEEESPAVEELSSPRMEDAERNQIFAEIREQAEDSNNQGFVQFKFDLVSRKTLDESLLFDEIPSREENAIHVDFRKKVEESFQFDEIYKSKMDNLNTKAQKLRIRSNFLTFAEKIFTLPAEKYLNEDLLNHNQASDNTNRQNSLPFSVRKAHEEFNYMFKLIMLRHKPFSSNFLFFLAEDDVSSPRRRSLTQRQPVGDEYEVDDHEYEKSKMHSLDLVFASGEVISVKFILDGFTECKSMLTFNPLLISINLEMLSSIKQFKVKFSPKDFVWKKHISSSFTQVYRFMSQVIDTTNDQNWHYLKQCILKMYRNTIHGFFEAKITIGKERILKGIDYLNTSQEVKLSKRRKVMISGKMWRSSALLTTLRAGKKFMTVAPSTFAHSSSAPQEDNLVEDALQKKPLITDPKKVNDLRIPSQTRPRRQSQTTINPVTPSTGDPKSSSMNVEKSSTVLGFESSMKHKEPKPNISQKALSQKMTTQMTTTSNNSDKNGKLKIPSMKAEATRHVSLNSPQRQSNIFKETKLETVDEKVFRKHTTNFSLSPSSNNSSPRRDNNEVFFSNNANWTKEKTKTKHSDGLDTSSIYHRMLSNGTTSLNKDREEAAQQLISAMQSRKYEDPEKRRQPIFVPRKPKSSIGSNSPQPTIIRTKVSPRRKASPRRKPEPDKGMEGYLFDVVYSNMFLELRDLLTLYPKNVIHIRDDENNTLLIAAAQAGYKEVVELLLNHGCDPNAQNNLGNTALHVSLAYQHFSVADCLVKHGAWQNVQNNRGKTAWDES